VGGCCGGDRLKQLITSGVRVVYYLEDRERTLDSPTDKILLAVSGFADEVERDKARQRTYDAMRRKALTGHVTGGVVFGYENVPVLTPDGKRDHVERRILEPEAAVVQRIFTLSAEGLSAGPYHDDACRGLVEAVCSDCRLTL
jgi:DNA invertase Pin-like site-specific DNA recombinase